VADDVDNKVSSHDTSIKIYGRDISKLFDITDELSRPKYPLIIGVVTMLLVIVGGGGWLINLAFERVEKNHSELYEKVFAHLKDGHSRNTLEMLRDDVMNDSLVKEEMRRLMDSKDQTVLERTIGVEEFVKNMDERVRSLERR